MIEELESRVYNIGNVLQELNLTTVDKNNLKDTTVRNAPKFIKMAIDECYDIFKNEMPGLERLQIYCFIANHGQNILRYESSCVFYCNERKYLHGSTYSNKQKYEDDYNKVDNYPFKFAGNHTIHMMCSKSVASELGDLANLLKINWTSLLIIAGTFGLKSLLEYKIDQVIHTHLLKMIDEEIKNFKNFNIHRIWLNKIEYGNYTCSSDMKTITFLDGKPLHNDSEDKSGDGDTL